MAFTFTENNAPSKELLGMFSAKQIYDLPKCIELANAIFETALVSEREGVNDIAAAEAVVIKHFDEYMNMYDAPNANNAPAPTQTDAPTIQDNGAIAADKLSIPSNVTTAQAAKYAQNEYKKALERSRKTQINGLVITAPKPADRYNGHGEMAVNANMKQKMDDWKKEGFVPDEEAEDWKAAYALASQAASSATPVMTAIYVNDKARPQISGYELQEDGKKSYVARSGYAFCGKLAKDYGTRIEPTADSKLGAYIQKRSKVSGSEVKGHKSLVVKFVGIGDYLTKNPDGIKVWEFDTKTKEFNAKSEISFTLYKAVKGSKGKVVDKSGTRTMRLSGKVVLPLLKAAATLTQDMTDAGIRVNTGESTIGNDSMPSSSVEEQQQLQANTIAILASMADNNDLKGLLGSFSSEAAQIREMFASASQAKTDGAPAI